MSRPGGTSIAARTKSLPRKITHVLSPTGSPVMKGHLIVVGATGGIGAAVVDAALAAAIGSSPSVVTRSACAHSSRPIRQARRSPPSPAASPTTSAPHGFADEIRRLRLRIDGVLVSMAPPRASGR
jgi:hypothetical protein